MTSKGSAVQLYERALRVTPAGTHSNSRIRSPHPVYAARAEGAHVWDVEGRRWLDFGMGNAAVLLGHGDAHVHARMQEAFAEGLGAGLETRWAVEAAERFLALVPHAEQVRFTNTGTEATMHAVHAARAATGRPAVAKVEGAYHGWWDDVFVSTWPDLAAAGPAHAPATLPGGNGLHLPTGDAATLTLPFNDVAATEALLDAHASRVAAVLVEPTLIDAGFIPADGAYLRALRSACDRHGILLIFDELLTGFRLAVGGAQQAYSVTPDLSLWGKALANGVPVAALAGTSEAMAWTLPGSGGAPFVGTFNGYAPAMAAVVGTLEQLADGSIIGAMRTRSDALKGAFAERAERHGVAVTLAGEGGHVQPYFTDVAVRDYRSAATTNAQQYALWHASITEHGILAPGKALLHGAFSHAHDDEAFETYLDASERAFAQVVPTPA